MYGSDFSAAASTTGGTLALTGLSFGSTILLAAGVVMVGVTLFLLARKNGEHRP